MADQIPARRKLCFILFLSILINAVIVMPAAAQSPRKQLSDELLTRFIADYPAMMAEFIAIGNYFPGIEDPTELDSFVESMKADEKGGAILAQYGWTEDFYAQLAAVCYAYVIILLEDSAYDYQANIDETYAMIDQDKELDPVLRDQLREQFTSALSEFSQFQELFSSAVHPADVELLRRYQAELKPILENPWP